MSNAPVEMKFVHIVHKNEHDRWSGREVLGKKFFPNKESAMNYAKAYNQKHNTEKQVPDYYVTMSYVGYEHVSREAFELHKATAEEIGIIQEWDWSSNI